MEIAQWANHQGWLLKMSEAELEELLAVCNQAMRFGTADSEHFEIVKE